MFLYCDFNPLKYDTYNTRFKVKSDLLTKNTQDISYSKYQY